MVSRSGIGLHMMWSPVITQMAGMMGPDFDGLHTMGMANGYNEDDMLMMSIMHFGMNANQTPPMATLRLRNNDWHDRMQDAGQSGAVAVLHQNDPNPINPKTVIRFDLPRSTAVDLSVYDLRGKLVQNLVRGDLSEGTHEAVFQPRNVASGLYCYVLNTDGEKQVGKMTLRK